MRIILATMQKKCTKKVSIEHYYIKNTPQDELFELLNKDMTKPKVKQKIRNELVRRGIKIVKVNKSETV